MNEKKNESTKPKDAASGKSSDLLDNDKPHENELKPEPRLGPETYSLLRWRKGPAQETFDPENDFWGDGNRILVVVDYKAGEEVALVDSSCDEHYSVLNLTDGTGDDSGVCDHEVKWWSSINSNHWPSSENEDGMKLHRLIDCWTNMAQKMAEDAQEFAHNNEQMKMNRSTAMATALKQCAADLARALGAQRSVDDQDLTPTTHQTHSMIRVELRRMFDNLRDLASIDEKEAAYIKSKEVWPTQDRLKKEGMAAAYHHAANMVSTILKAQDLPVKIPTTDTSHDTDFLGT